ncbi:hypothetical protein J010_00104 [Cryptococcus neoformans]|nr:hypothetical protein C355_00119 [Cryptococcus neoformans var. grubii Th84]OXH20015.1 hypothetical protein J010_00104 [Cryptococcus neoformans var. grubii]OXH39703.1 hypothetical protein J009_00120 [Cryptococcus neoformans var. grubii]OXH60248.1 hypothetical protein J003_00043 [Cryptococcus neoformans var. grubii]OXH60923.1 hypothetical protein J004_00125 [Cryptococcus neoformans var. grubii]
MPISTVAFLYPGAMGASLARVLAARRPHLKQLTSLQGRSQATISRAESCGLINVPFADLIAQSDVILSILPPSSAVSLAKKVIAHVKPEKKPIFTDTNAISPETAAQISSIFEAEDIPLYRWVYHRTGKSDARDSPNLEWGEEGKGMRVRIMEGSGVGGASALKMCYGGINKARQRPCCSYGAFCPSPFPLTAKAFLDELTESQPALTKMLGRAIPDMIPKAYRWVGEMKEISSFITSSILRSTPIIHNPADMYQGLAQMFQRVADDVKRSQVGQGGEEVKSLLDWAKRGEERTREKRVKKGE